MSVAVGVVQLSNTIVAIAPHGATTQLGMINVSARVFLPCGIGPLCDQISHGEPSAVENLSQHC